jgi:streptomycin 6-kinase
MTPTPTVPQEVLANVRKRWPSVADAWASHVRSELHELCGQYQASIQAVLPSRYGFVVAVDTPSGRLVMRGSPDPNGADQAAVAVALARLGISPEVHLTLTTEYGTWTVLNRIDPGTGLDQADPAVTALNSIFGPLAAMRDQPAPRVGMTSLLDWLCDRLEDDRLADLRPGTVVASIAERKAALELLAELRRDYKPGLCHGDASLGNIIAHGVDRWMYIDPRGLAGESGYDVAVLGLRVARFRNSSNLVLRISQIAKVSPNRVRAWMTVASTARV